VHGQGVGARGSGDDLAHLHRIAYLDAGLGSLAHVLSEGQGDLPGQGCFNRGSAGGGEGRGERDSSGKQAHGVSRLGVGKGERWPKMCPFIHYGKDLCQIYFGQKKHSIIAPGNQLDWGTEV